MGKTYYVTSSYYSLYGDGSMKNPYPTVGHAQMVASPGDSICLLPGEHDPFEIFVSGSKGKNIKFFCDPPHSVTIDGVSHKVRGLIECNAQSYVEISGFKLRNAPTDGIHVSGSRGCSEGIRITDNDIDNTGNSSIYICGLVMGKTIGVGEYWTKDVYVGGNKVRKSNTPGGRNEAITIGGGVERFVIEENIVSDTDQYGIGVKLGAVSGIIRNNRIINTEKHGVYLDAASRVVERISVHSNDIEYCGNGVVLAREGDRDSKNSNLRRIRITGNKIKFSRRYGILIYKHKWDQGHGDFSDIVVSSNQISHSGIDGIRVSGLSDLVSDLFIFDNELHNNRNDIYHDGGARFYSPR